MEADHYKAICSGYDVFGMDYNSNMPWEAKEEFPALFDTLCGRYDSVIVVANSIGAFLAMNALQNKKDVYKRQADSCSSSFLFLFLLRMGCCISQEVLQ